MLIETGYAIRDLDLVEQGSWLNDAEAVHAAIRTASKSHDVLAWPRSRGEPPDFGTPFSKTRFGR